MGTAKGGGSLRRHGCSGFGRAFCAAPPGSPRRRRGGEGESRPRAAGGAGPEQPQAAAHRATAAGGERAGANGGWRGRVTGGAAATPAGQSGRGAGIVSQQQHPRGSHAPASSSLPWQPRRERPAGGAERSGGRRDRQSKDGRDPCLVLERAVLAAAQRHLGRPAEHGGSLLPAGGGPLPRLPTGLLHLHDPAALRKVTRRPRRPLAAGPLRVLLPRPRCAAPRSLSRRSVT